MIEKIHELNKKVEKARWLSICIWILYIILLCFVSYYHEPWHDEGQAWLIARDDSIWHLLTVTTHWEGHPPLWHFALMPFAKAGVPFEFGIKSVNIIFCAGAMFLLILKSPMPWFLRFFLPFSYFCFYQYGVINRTYSLLMFAIMLVAYYYPMRYEKPFHEAVALVVLSGSMAYGMMIATGIALTWFLDFIKERKIKWSQIFTKNFYQNSTIKAQILFLTITFFWGLTILPLPSTAFMEIKRSSFGQNMFFCLFVMPGQLLCNLDVKDGVFDNAFTFFISNIKSYLDLVKDYGIYPYFIVVEYVLKYVYSILLQSTFLYVACFLGITKLFIIPMLLFFILASSVFLRYHHIGILACFYIFMLWQIFAEPSEKLQNLTVVFRKKFTNLHEYNLVKFCASCIIVGILGINIYWSYEASRLDVQMPYDISRDVAVFIKQEKMENLTFWTDWLPYDNGTKFMGGSYSINAYFKKNMITNINLGEQDHAYLNYQVSDKNTFYTFLQNLGKPDLYLGGIGNLDKVFGENAADDYVPVHEFKAYKVFKRNVDVVNACLYIHKSLLTKFPDLHEIKASK